MQRIEFIYDQDPRAFKSRVEEALSTKKNCEVQFIDYNKAYITYKEASNGRKTTKSNIQKATNN